MQKGLLDRPKEVLIVQLQKHQLDRISLTNNVNVLQT